MAMTATLAPLLHAYSVLCIFTLLPTCASVLLDVHLSLKSVHNATTDLCPFHMALRSNLQLRQLSIKEEIDLFSLHTPHITLYQADFDIDGNKTTEFINATASVVRNLSPCQMSWPNKNNSAIVSHDYAMYPISNTQNLQELSNQVVESLKQFIHRPPPIPDWVYSLAKEERKRALALISKYGSPNVMERFSPHVTIGYDKVYPPVRRKHVLDSIVTPRKCCATLAVVSIGHVGVGGSVLQKGIIAEIPLNDGLEVK